MDNETRIVNITREMKIHLVRAESILVYFRSSSKEPKEISGEVWYGPGVIDGEHHVFQKVGEDTCHFHFNKDDVSYLEIFNSGLSDGIFT